VNESGFIFKLAPLGLVGRAQAITAAHGMVVALEALAAGDYQALVSRMLGWC
jgi:hypothetical protein